MRLAWLLLGHLFVAIGFIGAFLPVLPTTPFMILAAWAYSRGSKRFETWLLDHPTMGPPIRTWREHGVIPPRAKKISVFMMAISFAVAMSFPTIPFWGKLGSGLSILGGALFVVTRPSYPRVVAARSEKRAVRSGVLKTEA